ncbi:hypothetical protein PIB30_005203 [Stylosanthes scabra]|uniref:Uncharacterized protein n=1 Tax=Stylosanthes scabra TaxID=79078 RepID=A0ABU6S3S7_9FABA|nr:hypothetical protein [Stylosanthes scabra]
MEPDPACHKLGPKELIKRAPTQPTIPQTTHRSFISPITELSCTQFVLIGPKPEPITLSTANVGVTLQVHPRRSLEIRVTLKILVEAEVFLPRPSTLTLEELIREVLGRPNSSSSTPEQNLIRQIKPVISCIYQHHHTHGFSACSSLKIMF